MKLINLCLITFTALAFSIEPSSFENHNTSGSGYTPDGTDADLWSMTYVYDDLKSGWRHEAICDDFILDSDATVDAVRFWIVFTGSIAPNYYEITIAQDTGDSDPNNASMVHLETCPAVLTDTGDHLPGVDVIIWQIDCTLIYSAALTGGEKYYLGYMFHDDTVDDYGILADYDVPPYNYENIGFVYNGSEWIRGDDVFGHRRTMFMEIWGTPMALQNETWGTIKRLF